MVFMTIIVESKKNNVLNVIIRDAEFNNDTSVLLGFLQNSCVKYQIKISWDVVNQHQSLSLPLNFTSNLAQYSDNIGLLSFSLSDHLNLPCSVDEIFTNLYPGSSYRSWVSAFKAVSFRLKDMASDVLLQSILNNVLKEHCRLDSLALDVPLNKSSCGTLIESLKYSSIKHSSIKHLSIDCSELDWQTMQSLLPSLKNMSSVQFLSQGLNYSQISDHMIDIAGYLSKHVSLSLISQSLMGDGLLLRDKEKKVAIKNIGMHRTIYTEDDTSMLSTIIRIKSVPSTQKDSDVKFTELYNNACGANAQIIVDKVLHLYLSPDFSLHIGRKDAFDDNNGFKKVGADDMVHLQTLAELNVEKIICDVGIGIEYINSHSI
jgi:hypothetical protein